MSYENIDLRLVKGDVASVSCAVKDYLKSAGFGLRKNEREGDKACIEGFNLKQDVICLFFSATPQIVRFNIEKKPDEQVQVRIKFDLFSKFRLFYYSVLVSLLCGFGYFLKKGIVLKSLFLSEIPVKAFMFFALFTLIGVVLFLLAFIFFVRMLSTAKYSRFIDESYASLSAKGFKCIAVLRSSCDFPDIWRGLFVFITLVIISTKDVFPSFSDLLTYDYSPALGTLIILGIFLLLAIVMSKKPALSVRLLFCLLGISLCLPFAIFGNAPLLNIVTRDIVEKVDYGNNKFLKKGTIAEKTENLEQPDKRVSAAKSMLNTGLMIVAGFWISVAFLILFFLWNAMRLPIMITKQMGRFYTSHPESVYYKALQPEETSMLFGAMIVLLWTTMSITIFIGLYFSFSIFERLLFDTNHAFRADIGAMFFNDTKTMLALLLPPQNAVYYHRLAMLAYSLPLTLIFSAVLAKNLRSFLYAASTLKTESKYSDAEKELRKKVQMICQYAEVSKPVIRLKESPYINSETEYLGFPFFKNVLIVTDTAYKAMKDKEGELDALLAHEIWHQKKHTFRRKLLCTLSDYTLFGNGFLALLQNSFKIEKEADAFAKKWLEHTLEDKGEAVSALTSLLSRQRRHNEVIRLKHAIKAGGMLSFEGLKDDEFRERVLAVYNKSPKPQRLWLNIKLLFRMYFGREILSYFHPATEQRMAWIQK